MTPALGSPRSAAAAAGTAWTATFVPLRVDVEETAWLSAVSCYAAAMQQLVTREPGAVDVARSCARTLLHMAVVRDDPPLPKADDLDAMPAPAPRYDWYSLSRL